MTAEKVLKERLVEVCSICERHDFLIVACEVCGQWVCRKHLRYTVTYYPKMDNGDGYARSTEHLHLCSECQQKPFIEIWDFANTLGLRV